MNSYTVYRTYLALKLHFTKDDYDIFQSQGKVRTSKKSFLARKDLYAIEKISKKYSDQEIVNFLVANFVQGNRWGGVFDENAHDYYLTWQGRQERLSYQFLQDLEYLNTISKNWSDIIDCSRAQHPYIIKAYLGNLICVETLTILDMLSDKSITNLQIADTIIWPDIRRIIVKYTPFLLFDNEQFRKVFRARFVNIRAENQSSGGSHGQASGSTGNSTGTTNDHGHEHKGNSTLPNKIGTKSTTNSKKSSSVALSDYFI